MKVHKTLRSMLVLASLTLIAVAAHAVSLGTNTSVSLGGATTSQGTATVSGASASGTIGCSTIGISGSWSAQVWQDSNGKYNIQYSVENTNATNTINLVNTTDYTGDGTVDVDYRSDLSSANPSMAVRSGGTGNDQSILWNYTFGGVPIGHNQTSVLFVNAAAASYSTSGGELTIWSNVSSNACVVTAAAMPIVHP